MNLQSNFGYCMTTQTLNIHFICKQDGITDKQTDGQTNHNITRGQTFKARGIKIMVRGEISCQKQCTCEI